MPVLEICCYGLDCACAAQAAGADRIELCSAPAEGGLTPSPGVLQLARRELSIPVHPIVRPRGGDFCYSAREFASMQNDIAYLRELGFAGVVIGVLTEAGEIDVPRMRQIMQQSAGLAVTFHRAFDVCRDPLRALQQLGDLGVARILTSGQQASALAGLPLLRTLRARSSGPRIMAGGGVRLANLEAFLAAGIEELHSSASRRVPSPVRYHNPNVTMSDAADAQEMQQRQVVDVEQVRAMKQRLQRAATDRR